MVTNWYLGPKPAAAINRVRHLQDEFSISTPALWSQYIDEELMKDNTMNILTSHTYDADTRTMDLIVTLVPLIDYSSDENLRISIMLTQNEIEDAQEDPNTVIEEYEHEHVLRTMLTAATGDPINKNLTANQTEQFTYSFTLPSDDDLGDMEPAWIAEHMEIVAFVNVIKEDKKDVIQVESAYLIE